MENILVRGVNWLGDAIMSAPALQRLREAKPRARITLLTHEKLAELWDGQPVIDDLLTFSTSENVRQISQRLRQEEFSAAIAFPNSIRSALELWLARIPKRIGYARQGRRFLLTDAIPPRVEAVPMRKPTIAEIRRRIESGEAPPAIPQAAHHVHDYLHLVSTLGASAGPLPPRIVVSKDECEKVAARLGLPAANEDLPFFGLNPGAEYGPAKRWPPQNFVAAALAINMAVKCQWIIFGGSRDRETANFVSTGITQFKPEHPVINLAGKTSLRELAAVLKSCRLVLTNDTGPMHLAAAVGTPVIVPFGSTSPELTGPIFSRDAQILRAEKIPCSPCFLRECPIDFRCMTRIEPDAAVAACLRILERSKK